MTSPEIIAKLGDLAAFLDHLGNEEKEQRPTTMSKPPMSAPGHKETLAEVACDVRFWAVTGHKTRGF